VWLSRTTGGFTKVGLPVLRLWGIPCQNGRQGTARVEFKIARLWLTAHVIVVRQERSANLRFWHLGAS
jgi:hypothetical protein